MKRLLLGMQSGLVVADASESGWRSRRRLDDLQPTSIAVDPVVDGRVYCATYNRGLWYSDDHGDHWRPTGGPAAYHEAHDGPGIPLLETTFVAVAPTPNGKQWHDLFVGTEPSRLFHSDDGGQHWHELTGIQSMPSKTHWQFPPRPYTHHVRWIAVDPADRDRLYVSIEFGAILRSFDFGTTWHDRETESPKDAHVLLCHPRAPGRLYAACGDGYMAQGYSFGESRDGGDSWRYASAGLEEEPYLYGLAVDPADPDNIRVAAAASPRAAHNRAGRASVYRKVGQGWQPDNDGLPVDNSFAAVLATDSQQPGTFYALNNHGLFCQNQREPTWQRVPLDWDAAYLDEHPMCLAVMDR